MDDEFENIYGLLPKCELKMAGFCPSPILRVYGRDEVEVHKLTKKERHQHPAILTKQTCSIKDLFYNLQENFSCGIQWVVPKGQDGLPARVANHSM